MQPLEMTKSELLADLDQNIGILHLIQGKTREQGDFWAYMSIRPSAYEEFIEKSASGENFNLASYGETLAKGWGINPPEDVTKEMIEKYDMDMQFQQQLDIAIEKAVENGR